MNTNLYRVIQEERSILWEVIVSMTVSKEVHMNVCQILNGYRDNAAAPPPRHAAAGIKERCDQVEQHAIFTSEL
jgi:hypothetical protein